MNKYFTLVKYGARSCLACWKPVPVPEPKKPQNIEKYGFLGRAALSLQYSFLQLEYAISRGGRLREWAKLNVLLGIIIGIPALIVLPMLSLAVAGICAISLSLLATVKAIFYIILYALASAALVTAAGMFVKSKHKK